MGVLLAIGSPLVAGGMAIPMSNATIKVERAFYCNKVVQPVGTILEVPKSVAAGLIASGKASAYETPAPVSEPPPEVEPPPEAEPAPAPKPKGRKKHVAK